MLLTLLLSLSPSFRFCQKIRYVLRLPLLSIYLPKRGLLSLFSVCVCVEGVEDVEEKEFAGHKLWQYVNVAHRLVSLKRRTRACVTTIFIDNFPQYNVCMYVWVCECVKKRNRDTPVCVV